MHVFGHCSMYTKEVQLKSWEAVFTDLRSVSPETEIVYGSYSEEGQFSEIRSTFLSLVTQMRPQHFIALYSS